LPVPEEGRDSIELHVNRWEPDGGQPKAVVQIVHGMAEHGGRYARVAEQLTAAGYVVYADDHRGHGKTALTPGDLGYFADEGGWLRIVDDLYVLRRHAGAEHPGLPVFLLGHSMGSFMVQDYLFSHGDSVDAVVLSGSTLSTRAPARLGLAATSMERLRVGARGKSAVIKALSTGDYNKRIPNRRTEFDWLSRDEVEVDAYIADPLCGFDFTVQGWYDLFTGLSRIAQRSNIERVPTELPLYIFSGTDCPVGRYGKGVLELVRAYEAAGLSNLSCKLYEGGRHEMLNETNRDEVQADLLTWLERTFEQLGQRAA
jgi:alpha-beta hydrolase superfamily lysophospholipase